MKKASGYSALLSVLLAFSLPAPSLAQTKPSANTALTAKQAYDIAREAYLYAYPIVSMNTTMRQTTNVPNADTVPLRAPVNQFAHVRTYPGANDKDVVRINFDTLYSSAWIDLSDEPMVLSVPDTAGRYYLLEMLDMWSDVFATVGTRTTGDKPGTYVLVGPDWKGALPQDLETIASPTKMFWILGRTQTNGPADYANVHKVQNGYRLTPLSQWGKEYKPPQSVQTDPAVDNRTPPKTQVNNMGGVTMLTQLSALLSSHRPHANDYPILFRLRALGIEPGKPFDPSKIEPAIATAINAAGKDTLAELTAGLEQMGKRVNGWNIATENIGTYGTSYRQRAAIAMGGLGANLPEDAIYPTAFFDEDGQPLSGANKYLLRFEKDKTPPADAFWSITMYDKDGFQVPNPINRFAIGDRDKLTFNADGSLDIYIQSDSPGSARESNWLPTPRDAPFQPTMRIYSPRREVANGTWAPPPLRRADAVTTGQSPQ